MKHSSSIRLPPAVRVTENAIQLQHIEAEIRRLAKQLAYLERVQKQYAQLVETEKQEQSFHAGEERQEAGWKQ